METELPSAFVETMKLLGVAIILIESIVQNLKPFWDKEKAWSWDALVALIVGLIVCIAGGIDIFSGLGVPLAVPFLGSVLTGVIAMRGSSLAHSLWELLGALYNRFK